MASTEKDAKEESQTEHVFKIRIYDNNLSTKCHAQRHKGYSNYDFSS